MEPGPSGSNGPTTRSKKRKNTGTNGDNQASTSGLDAHDKGDLCPWVLYVGKDKLTKKLGGEITQRYTHMPSIQGNQTLHLQILI